ncbi:transglycosylase domain-containing protein [Fervidibacillus halotolerans]|uniref:PBP1A family penicillin-binding protein n=1 Tax=Fervidibacillus halotolerans TaxID=2980027 RepID=A0A9E8RWX8_9BACI|nr:PBP1A family penicillin-binding protein [Fervidibacillus halotolerans]WAA12210.1 PBP1A family penicillin-binding protein [Fervidibacillus halotolerans]
MELSINEHLKKTWKYIKTTSFIASLLVIVIFFLITGIYTTAKFFGPPPLEVPQTTVYYANDGQIIGETSNGQKRYWVDLQDISPHLIRGTIAIEDKRFYSHIGFDIKRIIGALLADLKALAKVQGGSTITQQYARNLFLSHEKTWKRKIKEAVYTVRLETNYSKSEILEGYLNTIYYGHGVYGVEAASHYYFGKSAKDLTLAEATLLAGIPKGPSHYSPFLSMENAKKRQQLILSEMKKIGWITEHEAEIAAKEDIQLIGLQTEAPEPIAPYFQDVVRFELKNKIGLDDRTIALGGLKVYTTLDPHMQTIAEHTFTNIIANDSDIQAAFIAMDPETGYVKALIGGRDYRESPFNRAVQAKRQPGSTIKPILYYAALEKGYTPSTLLRSEKTTFHYDDGRKTYTPHNFNDNYAEGEITLAQALALSDNVYAVKTHLFLGMDTLAEYGKKFGITSKIEKVPSAALGTSNVRLIEMANAYSHLANGGMSVEPVFITKVVDYEGNVIYENEQENQRVMNPDVTFVINHLLTGIFDPRLNGYASVTGQSIIHQLSNVYAGKSGTTNTDSWMIGYTPTLVAAVWTGYDQGKQITKTIEKQFAKQIWATFMEQALENERVGEFKPTEGVIGVNIDPKNGLLATEHCPIKRYTYFLEGTEPNEYCIEHIPWEEDVPETTENEKKPWYKRLFDWFR